MRSALYENITAVMAPATEQPAGVRRQVRWWVLVLISVCSSGSYYDYDAIAPVVELLHRQLGFSYSDIGLLNAVYSLPNIFVAFLGGMLVYRWGAARVAVVTAIGCFAGTALVCASAHLWLMVLGRFLFGIGGETLFVATVTGVSQWFGGRQSALAMALFFSLSRLGSYLADLSPQLFPALFTTWQPPLVLSTVIAGVSLLAAVGYAGLDRGHRPAVKHHPHGAVAWRDLFALDAPVWGLLLLGMLFYAVVFPFRSTFAIEYFQNAKGLSLQQAGVTNSWVFFAAIFASPAFGWMTDRVDRKAALLTAGMLSLALSFVLLAVPQDSLWTSTALVGFSYSLVPAVIWPAVAERVPARSLGATFGLMTILQNLGMAAANMIVGWINDLSGAGVANPAGYHPMIAFFGLLSLAGGLIGVWMSVGERARMRS